MLGWCKYNSSTFLYTGIKPKFRFINMCHIFGKCDDLLKSTHLFCKLKVPRLHPVQGYVPLRGLKRLLRTSIQCAICYCNECFKRRKLPFHWLLKAKCSPVQYVFFFPDFPALVVKIWTTDQLAAAELRKWCRRR